MLGKIKIIEILNANGIAGYVADRVAEELIKSNNNQLKTIDEKINKEFRIDYEYGVDCSAEATVNHCDEWNYENELRQEGAKWIISLLNDIRQK